MELFLSPKSPINLRQRLGGSVVRFIGQMREPTGRCYIYEDSGRYTTTTPPVLAGLSADICIHGHLSAGSAAFECALEGLPVLLIDREGCTIFKIIMIYPKAKLSSEIGLLL